MRGTPQSHPGTVSPVNARGRQEDGTGFFTCDDVPQAAVGAQKAKQLVRGGHECLLQMTGTGAPGQIELETRAELPSCSVPETSTCSELRFRLLATAFRTVCCSELHRTAAHLSPPGIAAAQVHRTRAPQTQQTAVGDMQAALSVRALATSSRPLRKHEREREGSTSKGTYLPEVAPVP